MIYFVDLFEFCKLWPWKGSWEDSKSGRRVLLLPSSDPWGKLKISFFRIPVDNMSCISLSLDEKKALRKVKEVFRNSQRSIPNLDRSNGRTRQPVTKVYNHDFANRTSQHSISFDIFQSYLTRWTVNVMWKVNWIQWCIEMSLSSLLPLSLLLSLLVRSCVLSTMNKFQKSQRSLSKCVS